MKKVLLKILPFLLLTTLLSCNPSPREMPITTSSEEARELFIEGRNEWELWNSKNVKADSKFIQATNLDPNFALGYLLKSRDVGIPIAKDLIEHVSLSESLFIRAYSDYIYGEFESGKACIDSLLMLHPKDKHIQLFAGLFYFNRDEEKALDHFNKAIKIDKFYGAPYHWMGMQQMFLENFVEAEAAIKRFFDLEPYSEHINELYGKLYLYKGEPEKALNIFEKMKLDDPSGLYSHLIISWAYVHQEEFDKAISYLKSLYDTHELKNHNPVVKDFYIFEMEVYVNFINNKSAVSLKLLDERLEFFKSNNLLWGIYRIMMFKSWYLIHSGAPDAAIEILSSGLNLINNKDSLVLLDTVYLQHFNGTISLAYDELGQMEKAKEYLTEARKVYNNHRWKDEVDSNLMRAYESAYAIKTGDYKTAIKMLHVGADRKSATNQYYLALAYDLSGNYTNALKYYKRVKNNTTVDFAAFFYNKSKKRIEELESELKSPQVPNP